MGDLQALLFDVDGTLAETEEVHRESFNQAFAEAGLDWSWSQDDYRELLAVTGGKERIRHFLETHRPEFSHPELTDYIAGLHADKTRIYTTRVAQGTVGLRPGVARLLREAREKGMRIAIATTTTPANVTALLKASVAEDAESWFEVIAAGAMVPKKKPAPDIYAYALEKMNLKPEDCVALEDSENGLVAARALHIPTLVTESHYTKGHDFSGAALVVDHLGEPDQPFTVLEGKGPEGCCVDLAFLRELHRRALTADLA